MAILKRRLIEPALLGAGLAMVCVLIARQEAAHLIWPAWVMPAQGAHLLFGADIEQQPAMWVYHAVLFLQFFLLTFVLGWLAGRYRSRPVAT